MHRFSTLSVFLIALMLAIVPSVQSATINVTTLNDEDDSDAQVSLREAINAANSSTEDDIIRFEVTGTINLSEGMLPAITSSLEINGSSAGRIRIDGDDCRLFFINCADSDTVRLRYLTLSDGVAVGGQGGFGYGGGGGGAGLGGAVLVNAGNVQFENLVFEDNEATGGRGGGDDGYASVGGGGGGGVGEDGGHWIVNYGDGGDGDPFDGDGGDGGDSYYEDGADGGEGAGGGAGAPYSGTGGDGGIFGGGGGGGDGYIYSSWGLGGDGGYGGGGGGGAGTAGSNGGSGGTFGGDGGEGGYPDWGGGGGGGGAGLGGAVFVRSGATVFFCNCEFTGNSANGGEGYPGSNYGDDGEDGQGKGGAIFAMDGATVYGCGLTYDDNYASDADNDSTDNDDIYADIQPTYIGPSQKIQVESDGSWWLGVFSYSGNQWDVYMNGSYGYKVNTNIPYNAWVSVYLYDYGTAVYTEGMHLFRQNY